MTLVLAADDLDEYQMGLVGSEVEIERRPAGRQDGRPRIDPQGGGARAPVEPV